MSVKKKRNKIDVLLMSDNGLETVGGEQESTKIIINGVKDDYSLGVIQPGNISMPVKGVHYYPLTEQTRIKHLIKKPFSFIKYIWNVKKIISREKPKIIHTQAQVSFFIVALLKKNRVIPRGIIFVHTERGLYISYSTFFKRIFHFCMKELDILVTTTNFNMKHWKTALKNRGLSLEYKVIENTAGELFESYNNKYIKHNKSHIVLGFAGRYSDQKNWPLAVEISEKLNEELGEILYVNMAVGCLDETSKIETQKMFKELSKLLGSRFNAKVNIDLEAMDKFYYDTDVFILTSHYNSESFGRTLVEAMSRRTVVLTTDAGGPVEVIRDPKNVCNTADEFVEEVLDVFHDKGKMESEKELNLARVREKYSLENNVRKHLDLYSNLTNSILVNNKLVR